MSEENLSFQTTTELLQNLQAENEQRKKEEQVDTEPVITTEEGKEQPEVVTDEEQGKEKEVIKVTDFSVLGEEYKDKTPEQIKEEINAYKAKVQLLENNNIDIDPDLYRLNKLKVTDEGNFNLYKNLLFNEVSTIELLKLKEITNNPSLKDEPDIDELIKEKYGLDIEIPETKKPEDFINDEGELDDDAYRQYNKSIDKAKKKLRIAELNAKNDAESFKKQKVEDFRKQEVPFQTKEQRQEMLQKVDESWRPITDNIMDTYLKDKINIVIGEGDNKVEVEMPVDKLTREDYKKELQNFFINNNLPLTKQSYQQGVHYVHTIFKMNNFDNILKSAYERGIADEDAKWRDRRTNPSHKITPQTTPKTNNNIDELLNTHFGRTKLG